MKNLESPAYKLALFGALGSLGSAVLVEALSRQWEATALLDDLNAIPSRPGIRAKPGDPFDALAVSHAVAGMDAVLCNLCSQPLQASARQQTTTGFEVEFRAITALLDGLAMARVKRLLVIGDFRWLDETAGYLPEPGAQLQQRLLDSALGWTLVDAPSVGGEDLFAMDDFLIPSHSNEPDAITALRRFAAAVLDECQLTLTAHGHQRVRIQG